MDVKNSLKQTNLIINMHLAMKLKIAFFVFSCLLVTSCKFSGKHLEISEEVVSFSGEIENYQGNYKTGKLSYFGPLTRRFKTKLFPIDRFGNFNFTIKISLPLFNGIFFDVEGNYYSGFLIEPNKEYNISFKNNEILFHNESGKHSNELAQFYSSLNASLGEKIAEAERLHEKGLAVNEYILKQKELENEMSSFLLNYCTKIPLSEKTRSVVKSAIKYKTAQNIINYRFDYSHGFPMPGKVLPDDFYKTLFEEYSIKSIDELVSRSAVDYLANIVSVLSKEKSTVADKLGYIKSLAIFSPNEMKLLIDFFQRNKAFTEKQELKDFIALHEKKIMELNHRYYMHLLLKNCNELKSPLAKDLVICQGLESYFFANKLQPNQKEWTFIEKAISHQELHDHLKRISSEFTEIEDKSTETDHEIIMQELANIKKKYIEKYKGKVVYIDFYSTWCGPCRKEMPFAKQLHKEFLGKEFVSLNLCAKSKKEDWELFVKQHKIEGENYFLTNEEFYLLSELFKVNGFPTYVLLDKDGKVSDYNALRPSAKKRLYSKINELLDN